MNDKCHLDLRLDNVFMCGDFYLGFWRTADVEVTDKIGGLNQRVVKLQFNEYTPFYSAVSATNQLTSAAF